MTDQFSPRLRATGADQYVVNTFHHMGLLIRASLSAWLQSKWNTIMGLISLFVLHNASQQRYFRISYFTSSNLTYVSNITMIGACNSNTVHYLFVYWCEWSNTSSHVFSLPLQYSTHSTRGLRKRPPQCWENPTAPTLRGDPYGCYGHGSALVELHVPKTDRGPPHDDMNSFPGLERK